MIEAAVKRYLGVKDAEVVDDPAHAERVVLTDPRDDFLVALAQSAGADALVSGDRHLLNLTCLDPPVFCPRDFLEHHL